MSDADYTVVKLVVPSKTKPWLQAVANFKKVLYAERNNLKDQQASGGSAETGENPPVV